LKVPVLFIYLFSFYWYGLVVTGIRAGRRHELWLNSGQRRRIYLFSEASGSTLGPTESPM